jgi:translocation and assembly module TamB
MRKALRITLWVLGGIFFLIFLAVLVLQTRPGKNFVRDRAVSFLRTKLKTEVYIGDLDYNLPKWVVLKNVLLKDQAKDTLLSAREMRLDIAMLRLLDNTVSIQKIYLDGVRSHVYRKAPDSTYNFDYIVKAFLTQGTDTAGVVTDTSARLVMNVDEIVLHDVHFRSDDYSGGSWLAFDVGDLNLTMKETDPERLIFKAGKLYANNVRAVVINDKSILPEKVTPPTGPLTLQLGADVLDLHNVVYNQKDLVNKFFMEINLGDLVAHPGVMDIPNQSIAVNDLSLNNTSINVVMGARAAELAQQVADTIIEEEAPPAMKWRVTGKSLNLNNVGFVLNNDNEPRLPSGIDYAHLNVSGLVLDADNINYTTDTIEAVINHLAAKEKSGLDIRELKTRFSYHPQGGYLRDLYLQTSNTILQNYAEVKYPSLDALTKNPNLMQMDINLENSVIGMKDVLIFAPQLQQQPFFRKHRNGMVKLNAKLNGRLDDLNIEELYASGLGSTEVNVSGKVYGMPDVNRLSYNLNVAKLQSSRNDIETLLPPATLKQIRLPDRFGATGTISGTTLAYHPNLIIVSTDGNATVRGDINMAGGAGRERYDLAVKTQNLNIGRIIRDTMLGAITADLTARGQGFDINTMNAAAKGTIHAATFKRYTYRGVAFNTTIAGKRAKFKLDSNDPNAHLKMEGNADFRGKYPAIYADATIDSIDLQDLHFYSSELRMRGTVHAEIQELNPDYPRATIVLNRPSISANNQNYFLDSLYIVSNPSADSGNNIVVNAQAINAHLWGHTPLTKIGDIVTYHINRHYVLNDSTGRNGVAYKKKYNLPANYDLNLIAKVENDPLLKGLVPDLKSFDTIRVEGGLSPDRLFLNADAPNIVYADYTIEDGKVRVNGTDSALTYVASVDHFTQKSMDIWYANASGNIRTNTITSDISIADPDSTQKFRITGSLQRIGNDQVLQLQRGLMLNYKEWSVNEPNKIVFGKNGFYVQNFGIRNGNESISVNSVTPTYNAPLKADITDFLLSNITEVISKDTLLANGVLAGTINLQKFNPEPQVTSMLGISNFSVLGDTIGNVSLNVRSASANAIDANVGITGFGNNVTLDGLYYPKPVNGNNLNMHLLLNPLNVAAFEGLAQHQIKNTSGYLRGDLKVNGTLEAPSINGHLLTDNLSTNVSMLNTQFTMPAERIDFNGDDIIFNRFNIKDSAGNLATLNGKVMTNKFKDVRMDLNLRANNWQAMSSTAKENDLFYGRLFLTTNANINGAATSPSIDGTLDILKGTSVTVTIPESGPGVQEREGIVEFVNASQPGKYYVFTPKKDTVEKIGKVAPGSEVNLNVSIDENAEFSVIIDEGTGDFVRIRGKGNLNTTVAPDGTLGLVGTYEILDGSYHLTYNFIRRLFRVQPGSTIVFSGDPTQAELNVTALYEANVPPYDLVSRQVPDPAQLVYFKQKLPFEVQMKLTGPMMQPIINFDIVLPEDKNLRVAGEVSDVVQARLAELRANPSDLNKQVFALIILNRFVAEDIFQNGAGGGGAEAIARQSASRFISEQLNKFAGGLVKGLDLTLDLQTSEDYTTGERRNRTDLSVGASKRLLNDRLTVTVGSNFQVEGEKSSGAQGASYIPGNLAIDYDLTADRRYRMRIFRRSEEEVGIGNVVETGASFIVNVDYNRFRQVFMSRRKQERLWEERRKQRQEQNRRDSVNTAVVMPRKEETDTN